MARNPRRQWRPIPENKTAPRRDPGRKTVFLHSAVGAGSLYGFFYRKLIVVESHEWIGKTKSEQYVDDLLMADAQYKANPWGYSIETADNGDPDNDPWNAYQREEIAQTLAWQHKLRGVPLRQCRHWLDDGVGYHAQFDEWTVAEGIGKTCPGKARIKQIPGIIARAKQIVEGNDEMTDAQYDAIVAKLDSLERAVAAVDNYVWATPVAGTENASGVKQNTAQLLRDTWRRAGVTVAVELNEADRAKLRQELLADILPLIPTAAQIAVAVNTDAAKRLAQ